MKTLSFATIPNAIGSAVNELWISSVINLASKTEIHTAIQDGKYAANMRTRQSISQSVFRVDFISALLGNYYGFFYAVNMCFKSNMLFIRLGYCL